MGSSAPACLKYLMFVFNFIFFVLGCAILGVGIWLKVQKGDYAQVSEYNFVTAANLAIASGVVVIIVAFLGCCGAIKEIKAMLLAFFIFLALIFILEIAAGAVAYVKRGKLEDELHSDFMRSIRVKYGTKNEKGVTDAIDKFQRHFHCCGFDSYRDWQNSTYYAQYKVIPKSCCTDESSPECGVSFDKTHYNLKGCYKEVKQFLKSNLLIIGAVGIVFALIQILGMIFSMVLYCSIDSGRGTLA